MDKEMSVTKYLLIVAGIVAVIVMTVILAMPKPAHSDEPVLKAFVGANGVWYESPKTLALPTDFELGGNGRASLSPHISAVGAGYYGVQHSYLRGSVGLRFTVTDAANPDLSLGLGMQYHASSEPGIRPQEWKPDATLGWRPSPLRVPKLTVIAQGSYGLLTGQVETIAGVRYQVWQGGGQ